MILTGNYNIYSILHAGCNTGRTKQFNVRGWPQLQFLLCWQSIKGHHKGSRQIILKEEEVGDSRTTVSSSPLPTVEGLEQSVMPGQTELLLLPSPQTASGRELFHQQSHSSLLMPSRSKTGTGLALPSSALDVPFSSVTTQH